MKLISDLVYFMLWWLAGALTGFGLSVIIILTVGGLA